MQFLKQSVIGARPERVFAFHELPDVLTLLLPPWESARVIQSARISEVGSQAIIETKVFGPMTMRWIAEHRLYDPPRSFEDVQIKGPFKSWRHRHIVEPHPDGALLRDQIDYEPPLGFLGRAVAPWLIEPRLRKLFEYRHQVTQRWCESPSSQAGV
ncbi:MAG TPA: SRPBCC family protein [Pyrinomonadaceae bacterium]|nr:SRPBCC family protein [Pyrinomonadaceae bacterium]